MLIYLLRQQIMVVCWTLTLVCQTFEAQTPRQSVNQAEQVSFHRSKELSSLGVKLSS